MGTVYRPQSRHPERGAGKRYLLASDFDQTLSFNDSGIVLSEMLGISGFVDRCAGLSTTHLVQQGAGLDPEPRARRDGPRGEGAAALDGGAAHGERPGRRDRRRAGGGTADGNGGKGK